MTQQEDENGNPIYDIQKISRLFGAIHTLEHEVDVVTPAVQCYNVL